MDFDDDNQNLIGIFTTDAEFVVQVWDAALERMTGISAQSAVGKSIVETIPDLERRGLLARFRRVLEEGTIEILSPAFHKFLIPCAPRISSKHFAEMRQRTTISPLKENETIRGLLVTIEDVTERVERERGLTEQLENSDENVRLQAAKAISDDAENLDEENAAPIINALGDKSWRVRRELVEGLSRRAAPEAIAALLRAMQAQHFDFGILNSALQVLQATSVETTKTLIEFLNGPDADLRMQAALALGEQKDRQAIPALLAALNDENANVRYHAIEALGKLKATDAVVPLLEIAEARDFFLSFAALEALRQIADESITERVLSLSGDNFLREVAVETLGAVGDEEIVSPLIELLNEDKSAVAAVANALAALFDRFKDDSAKTTRIIETARRSINETGRSNLLEALDKANETDLVPLVRVGGWLDDEKIRQKLGSLLENEKLREKAAEALAEQGEAAVDLLIQKLTSDDREIRQTAVRALGNLKSERAVPALIKVLEEDSELTPEAAQALGQIGDMRAFEALIQLLEAGDAGVLQAAVNALKSLAHPETVPRLRDLLSDADPPIRESAIRVAGYLGAKGSEDEIFAGCEDSNERVRQAAIEQFPNIADERAVPTLIRVSKQDSPRLRAKAVQAL
ncbi:MAG TPA: HEAT repeat domain-containing protein, partial [Pyrinomonadaceae bacterium]|nr:HEAT repeat domain-containing protein [Pyrinomonadaceae bacterium]